MFEETGDKIIAGWKWPVLCTVTASKLYANKEGRSMPLLNLLATDFFQILAHPVFKM